MDCERTLAALFDAIFSPQRIPEFFAHANYHWLAVACMNGYHGPPTRFQTCLKPTPHL